MKGWAGWPGQTSPQEGTTRLQPVVGVETHLVKEERRSEKEDRRERDYIMGKDPEREPRWGEVRKEKVGSGPDLSGPTSDSFLRGGETFEEV